MAERPPGAEDGRGNGDNREARLLHEAAWPDLFGSLQAAYAELTQAQRELEERESDVRGTRDLLRRVLESMSEAVLLLDCGGRVVEANPAAEEMFGAAADGLSGQPLDRVCGTDEIPATPQRLLQRSSDGTLTDLLITVTDGGGRSLPVDVGCSLVRDEHGKITGVLVVARDVTERERLESELKARVEELAERDRRKNEYLATLAHELRNPLAPVLNAVAILQSRPSEAESVRAREMIERQVGHMRRLIDDLLDAARVTEGKIALDRETMDLRDAARAAADSVRPAMDRRDHRLVLSVPQRPVHVSADETRIEQVLTNLLDNAAKYTQPGGRVDLEMEVSEAEAMVRIRDTGEGFDVEARESIFELFAQGERSLDRSEGGLGIGLTVVKRLVEMHGGSVAAHSAGPGQGSEFTVRLPLAEPPGATTESGADTGTGEFQPLRVLVVDDNADSAESLAMLLEAGGHRVRVAFDGAAALEAAAASSPHVVLLDIGLPGLDGYEVARRLRRGGPSGGGLSREALIVAISGYAQEEDLDRSAEAGIDHHLVKPVEPDQVLDLLARVDPESPRGQ